MISKNHWLCKYSTKQLLGALLLMSVSACAYTQDTAIKSLPTEEEVALQAATKFVAEIKSIDWAKITQPELQERMSKTVTPFGWALNDVAVARFETNKGPRTTVEVMIEPTGVCLKQSTWLQLLGNPISLTLAEPFQYTQMPTPEAIRKALSGALPIAKLHYLLNGIDSFSFGHEHSTFANQAPTKGCFHYLHVLTKS